MSKPAKPSRRRAPGKGRARQTEATAAREDRLLAVEALLLGEAGPAEIVAAIRERFHISPRTAARDYQAVRDRVATRSPAEEAIATQRAIVRGALAAGRYGQANAALARLERMTAARPDDPYSPLGPAPAEEGRTLEGQGWMFRLLCSVAEDAIRDPALSPAARREEIRKTAATMARLVSHEELLDARQRLERDADDLADVVGPALEDVPPGSPPSLRLVEAEKR